MSFKTVSKAEYTRIVQKDSPSKKLDGLVLFVLLMGLFDSEFFVFLFQRYSFLKGVAVETVAQDNG